MTFHHGNVYLCRRKLEYMQRNMGYIYACKAHTKLYQQQMRYRSQETAQIFYDVLNSILHSRLYLMSFVFSIYSRIPFVCLSIEGVDIVSRFEWCMLNKTVTGPLEPIDTWLLHWIFNRNLKSLVQENAYKMSSIYVRQSGGHLNSASMCNTVNRKL